MDKSSNDTISGNRVSDGSFSRARSLLPDWPVLAALAAVFVGWFLLEYLSVTIASWHQGFHFYDLPALIDKPARLISGIDPTQVWTGIPSGVLCFALLVAPLLAPLAPPALRPALARYGFALPLVVIVLGALMLWYQSSRDTFMVAPGASDIAHAYANLGNAIARRVGGSVAHYVSFGAGVWVSLIGALYLAYHGLVRSRLAKAP